MNDLGLVKPVDRFCEGVVIAVSDAADRRLDPGLGEPFGVLDGHVLAAAVAVVDEAAAMNRAPVVQGLFKRVQDEAGMGCAAGAPADIEPSERHRFERDGEGRAKVSMTKAT